MTVRQRPNCLDSGRFLLPSLFYCFIYSLSVYDITNGRCAGDVDVVQGMKELFNVSFLVEKTNARVVGVGSLLSEKGKEVNQ